MAQSEKLGDLQTTVAVSNEKTQSALKQIDSNVCEVKEDVSDVKVQIEDLSKRLAVLENKNSFFCNVKNVVSNGFAFFQKYYKFILVSIALFVILFGGSLGIDVSSTVATLISLIGL